MLAVLALTVLIDGVPIESSYPACVVGGRVLAPLVPIVARIATSAGVDPDGTVEIARGSRRIRLRLGERAYSLDGTTYVPLALVARRLGGSVAYDGRARTVTVAFPPAPLATPAPWSPSAPTVAPTTVFTPQPVRTPTPPVLGVPRPRRTPVEVPAP